MGKVSLSDIFRRDYLSTISTHIKRIKSVLDEYDVAIFMARKAICFYEALKLNGEVEETKCRVVSSRVIYYDRLRQYCGLKVAVVDDVVVRGKSINRVAEKLRTEGIDADFFVAACEEKFQKEFRDNNNAEIITYVTYPRHDIYHFSGLITQYIEASMRTFNVDSPIYCVDRGFERIMRVVNSEAVCLTSGLQAKYGIESRSLYLHYSPKTEKKSELAKVLENSVIKIRFYFDDEKFMAVPFVLLPACKSETLDLLYQKLRSEKLDDLVNCADSRRVQENKLKLISYCLSDALFCQFAESIGVEYSRDVLNDITQFDEDLDEVITSDVRDELKCVMSDTAICNVNYSRFLLSNYIGEGYEFISSRNTQEQHYEDFKGDPFGHDDNCEDGKLGRIAFSFLDICEWIKKRTDNSQDVNIYVSSVIDVFVDKGFIVPAILHLRDNSVLRAYKMGEFSKLTRDQWNSFIRMLYAYQTSVKRDLDKIELEKLCVLFFKSQIAAGRFVEKTSFEEDDYCVAYSLYGPRVSTSKVMYSVPESDALVFDLNMEGRVTEKKKTHKYYLENDIKVEDPILSRSCDSFASIYARLNKVFTDHPYVARNKSNPNKSNWNQYVHTLDQFLTLLAIGLDNKDRILSICAEVLLVTKLHKDMFFANPDQLPMKRYKACLSGINSGLWKYRGYKGEALQKTIDIVGTYDSELVFYLLDPLAGSYNRNEDLCAFLDECGVYLYKAAYIVSELLRITGRTQLFDFNSFEEETKGVSEISESDSVTIFDTSNFYFDQTREMRKSIADEIHNSVQDLGIEKTIEKYFSLMQYEAKNILDKCDLYLESNSVNSRFIDEFFVLHSDKTELPNEFVTLSECSLKDFSKAKENAVFSIPYPMEIDAVVSSAIKETSKITDCDYLLVRHIDENYGYTQIRNEKKEIAKGSVVVNNLQSLVSRINELPRGGKRLYVYQSDDKEFERFGDIIVEKLNIEEYFTGNKLYTYSILQEGKKPMTENGNGNSNFSVGRDLVMEPGSKFVIVTGSGDVTDQSKNGDIVRINDATFRDCSKLLAKVQELSKSELALSGEQYEELKNKLKSIEEEMLSKEPRKNRLDKAISWLKGLKGSAEFLAAIATLCDFLMKLFNA